MQRKQTQDRARILVDKILASPEVHGLASKIMDYDKELYKHSLNVAFIVAQIAYNKRFDREKKYNVVTAALLHDIGKTALPIELLNKTTTLTPEEFEKLRSHVTEGVKILREAGFNEKIIEYVGNHHECINGNGYPNGYTGDKLSDGSKILGAVDKYDALTARRVYGVMYNTGEAISILKNEGATEVKYLQDIIDCEAI